MNDYISSYKAYIALMSEAENHGLPASKEAYERAARIVSQIPAADVQSVRHGHWIKEKIDDDKSLLYGAIKEIKCSVCNKGGLTISLYCPNCGARMDGGEAE